MADNDNPDTNMDKVDKKVLKLAALLDATMRFHVEEFDLDEMEINYIQTWLRKERDPILATTTGDRDPKKEDEGSSTEK